MSQFFIRICFVLISISGFTSCVSQLKYNRLSTEVSGLRNERDEAMKKAESTRIENVSQDKELKKLQDEIGKLKLDSAQSGMMYRKNRQLLNDLFDKYDRLDKSYNSLLSNSSNERTLTEKELQRKEADLARREKELADAKVAAASTQAELEKKKEEAAKLSQDVGTKDNQIKEMKSKLAAKEKAMQDIKSKMSEALLTLNNSELQVTEKEGKVYVVLPNRTLFGTGSYSLQPAGKDAVQRVAQVLAQNPDLDVSIEGHTDNSPFKPAPAAKPKKGAKKPVAAASSVKDNWDLSSLRAASVAKVFYTYGIAGNRISAAGKGEFYPLDNSNSEEAKARNRRIEIVISPKLSVLYDLINGK